MKRKKLSLSGFLSGKIPRMLLAMAKAMAGSLIPYVFIGYMLAGGTGEAYTKAVTDFLASCLMALLFSFFFHRFYTAERNEEYSLHMNPKENFEGKAEWLRFMREDGAPFLWIYGVLAVLYWILIVLFYFWQIKTPLSVVFFFVFPFTSSVMKTLPQFLYSLASPFISGAVIFPLIVCFALHSRKRLYQKYRK